MKLRYQEHSYPFRSPGLFVFLRILQGAYPGWVDLAGIQTRLPGIDPGQLARFINLLESAGLTLVHYETKTRGRYRLLVAPESIAFSGDRLPPIAATTAAPTLVTPKTATPLAVYQDEAWVFWAVALIHSTLALHSGVLSGENSALFHLDNAEAATGTLPLWTTSVVYVRQALVLERASRYREATYRLRRVDTAVRHGRAHPAAKARAQLVRAKMLYDQGLYAKAEDFLDLPSEQEVSHDPHWLNMKALMSGRKFLTAKTTDSTALLGQTLSTLAEALGSIFLGLGDTSLLDGLCYNFGNNLLRGIKRGLIPEASADTVMQWLAANMLVCRKLGVGEDSILANLLLIDVGLDHGYSIQNWPHQLRCGLNFPGDLGGVLTQTLAQARQTGNRLEIAQCLRRKLRLTTSADSARRAYFEAVDLFSEQGRKDVALELAEEWRIKFGRSPPTLPRGHRT